MHSSNALNPTSELRAVKRISGILANVSLVLVSLTVAFVLCELAARFLTPGFVSDSPVLQNAKHAYQPNQRVRHKYLEWDYEMQINGEGFREDLALADIPPGSVVALGDSFTEGYGVSLEDTFAKVLERDFETRGSQARVFNAGHSDTNPNYYYSVWKKYFADHPSIETAVVGLALGNDLIARVTDGWLRTGDNFGGNPLSTRIRIFLAENLVLYNYFNYLVKSNRSAHNFCHALGACAYAYPSDMYLKRIADRLVPITADRLAEHADAARSKGQRFLVAIIPPREQARDDLWEDVEAYYDGEQLLRFNPNEAITKALRERCVEVLDLTPSIVAHLRAGGEALYFKFDGHFNPAGHVFMAKAIAERLQSEPESCPSG